MAPVTDPVLLQHILDAGANVNHADVHNTTPLMDVIRIGDEERVMEELDRCERNERMPVLDTQNCTMQSALFRASFKVGDG